MKLSQEEQKRFRAIGHKLNPIVTVAGNGLSDKVCNELNRALDDHELIKIKVAIADRQAKQQIIEQLCDQLNAILVQSIGHTALIFRAAEKPKAHLSNLLRL